MVTKGIRFRIPILRELAIEIEDVSGCTESSRDFDVIALRATGKLPPLFLVQSMSGQSHAYESLATLLPSNLPVFAIRGYDLHMPYPRPSSIEMLAAQHVRAIRRVWPNGPYRLLGWSIGGVIAYEIARQLVDVGQTIDYVGLVDTYNHTKSTKNRATAVTNTQFKLELALALVEHTRGLQDALVLATKSFDQVEALIDYCLEQKLLPSGVNRAKVLLLIDNAVFVSTLCQAYAPPPSRLSIDLFVADDRRSNDLWRGWCCLIDKTSMLRSIGGDHCSIMKPPFVNLIVESVIAQLVSQLE